MHRILLLSFALVCPAFAERAVYTGTVKVQSLAAPSASSVIRIAEVIDLESGKIVTVGLTGTKLNFSFNVGPATDCVIAKTTDGKGHSTTAFAQAASATDQSGSKFALSTVLRGADATVTLADAGASHWPRTLIGTGSLVAGTGVNPATTPGGISLSTISVTLSEPYSKLANSSGGTLEQGSEVVGQAYRDAIAKSLKYPASNGTAANAGATAGSGAVVNLNSGASAVTLTGNPSVFSGAGLSVVNTSGLTLVKTGVGTLTYPTTNPLGGSLSLYPASGGSLGVTSTGTVNAGSIASGAGAIRVANNTYAPPFSSAGSINVVASGLFPGNPTIGTAPIITTLPTGAGNFSGAFTSTVAVSGSIVPANLVISPTAAVTITGGVAISSLPVSRVLSSTTTYTGVPVGGGNAFLTNTGSSLTSLLAANPNLTAYTLNEGTLVVVGSSAALTRTNATTLTISGTAGTSTVTAGSVEPLVIDPATP